MVPTMSAERVAECAAFLAKKYITAMPAQSAAIRLVTNPTESVNSTPQADSIKTGANIKIMDNTVNRIELKTESR